jgi:hypothetical protein
MVVVLLLCGCDSLKKDPYGEWSASNASFTTTVYVLKELHSAGKLAGDDLERVKDLLDKGDMYLEEWEDSIESGKPNAEIVAAFKVVMNELNSYTE